MKIYIRHRHCNGFKRYLLQREDGRFWSGRGWKRSIRRAVLFANINDCHDEYFRLVPPPGDRPDRKFVARFDVYVYGDADFTLQELQEFLLRQVKFTIINDEGPAEGCRTVVYARFGSLIEKREGHR